MRQGPTESSPIAMQNYVETPFSVTVIVYILGTCTMLPWNFLITANSYWQYKLRNTTLGENWNQPNASLTNLQLTFIPIIVLICTITQCVFGFLTSTITKRVKEKKRILGSLTLSLAALGVITLMTIVSTDKWQKEFFVTTLFMAAFMNSGIAIFEASLFGMVGHFPTGCIVALMSGQSLAGVVSSFSLIISLAIGKEDPVTSGIIYFCIAIAVIIASIYTYVALRKMDFYEVYKIEKNENEEEETISLKQYFVVLKKISWMGFSLGFLMVVTVAVFPAVQVYVTSSYPPSKWTKVYFQPTITFLLYNVVDMIGKEAARWKQWPSHKGWFFHVICASRILFIPLILLCHGENKSLTTFFEKDIFYIIINFFFALSHGYFSSLTMIYYPRMVEKEETELAGTLMSSLLGVGLVVGSLITPLFVSVWGPNG